MADGFSNSNTAVIPTGLVNRLFNGDVMLAPSGTQTIADAGVMFVNYRALTQTASIQAAQSTFPEAGQAFCATLTQTQSTAQRIGFQQTISTADCGDLRSAFLSLSGRVNLSVAGNVRFAVLEWTGTADASPADVVADWTSSAYIQGSFFVSSVTVLNQGIFSASAGEWGSLPYIPIQAGASLKNLIVFVWTQNEIAQNTTLKFGRLQLNEGTQQLDYEHRPLALAQSMAQIAFSLTVLSTIATLQAQTWDAMNAPAYVTLVSNYYAGDGGGGFRFDASDTTSSDNAGTIIVTSSGRRYKREYSLSNPIDTTWFGLRAGGASSDAALSAANTTAITRASAVGYWISLPAGRVYANLWTMAQSNRMSGAGDGVTILTLGDARNTRLIYALSKALVWHHDFSVDMNFANNTGSGTSFSIRPSYGAVIYLIKT